MGQAQHPPPRAHRTLAFLREGRGVGRGPEGGAATPARVSGPQRQVLPTLPAFPSPRCWWFGRTKAPWNADKSSTLLPGFVIATQGSVGNSQR